MNKTKHILALKYDLLTGFYDYIIGKTMPEQQFKRELIRQANLKSEEKVLDFGSGTATLSILVKRAHSVNIQGIDVDDKIIQIAKRKIEIEGLDIPILNYDRKNLPFEDDSSDKVISSLVFHHLNRAQKELAIKEIYRILKPGGVLLIADWGKPSGLIMSIFFLMIQLLDGFETTSDNKKGKLPHLLTDQNFQNIEEFAHFNTVFGTIRLIRGKK